MAVTKISSRLPKISLYEISCRFCVIGTVLLTSLLSAARPNAEELSVNCIRIRSQSRNINANPDIQISADQTRLFLPAAFVRTFYVEKDTPLVASSVRLVVSLPDFMPVPLKDDPGYLGTGWGNTISISIEKTGTAKSGADLLKYFLRQNPTPPAMLDILGFKVINVEHGLDLADELHVSNDKKEYLLCNNTNLVKSTYCVTVINIIPGDNMKLTFASEYLAQFEAIVLNLKRFIACFQNPTDPPGKTR